MWGKGKRSHAGIRCMHIVGASRSITSRSHCCRSLNKHKKRIGMGAVDPVNKKGVGRDGKVGEGQRNEGSCGVMATRLPRP